MPDAKENLYTNLTTLIWGAFIGIVSFQILGPNLATAIHKQVGCTEQTAYDFFSRLYLLLPSCICLFFIVREFHFFKKYLSPFDEYKMDLPSQVLIWGVIGLWAEQLIATYYFLKWEGDSAPFGLFALRTILECLVCLTLMIVGILISYRKYRHAKHPNRSDKGYFFQLSLTCVIIFIILVLFAGNYIARSGQKVFLRNAPDNKGFLLLQEKDSLEDGLRHIAHVIDKIRLKSQLDTVKKGPDSIAVIIADTSRRHGSGVKTPAVAVRARVKYDTIFSRNLDSVNAVAARLAVVDDVLYHLLHDIKEGIDTLAKRPVNLSGRRPDMALAAVDRQHQDVSRICGLLASTIDTLNHREKALSDSAIFLPDSLKQKSRDSDIAILKVNYGNYMHGLQLLTDHLANNIDNEIKKEIGDQLRYTQLIGTPILFGLFFSLLSLYIFLKINSRLTNKELTQQKMTKRRLTATGDHSPEREDLDIAKEQEVEESSELTNNTWLFITIVVWLLVAFFKPIDDNKIDLAEPFKTLTFSDPGNPLNPASEDKDKGGNYKFDTTITVTSYFKDSVKIVPYIKDTITNRRIIEHDTIFRFLQLDTARLDSQFKNINKRLDYLVPPPRKPNTGTP